MLLPLLLEPRLHGAGELVQPVAHAADRATAVSVGGRMYVIGGSGSTSRTWTAWPPPGPVPLEVFEPLFGSTLDETGWSIQSQSIDLSVATVTVTHDGSDMPVAQRTLDPWYGSRYAIAFRPSGWTTEPGRYQVAVTGIASPFSYEVNVVGCE